MFKWLKKIIAWAVRDIIQEKLDKLNEEVKVEMIKHNAWHKVSDQRMVDNFEASRRHQEVVEGYLKGFNDLLASK